MNAYKDFENPDKFPILARLADRIFYFENSESKKDGVYDVVEGCDDFFREELTPKEIIDLGKEIQTLGKELKDHEHKKDLKRMVDNAPAWKRGLLDEVSKSTCDKPRKPTFEPEDDLY